MRNLFLIFLMFFMILSCEKRSEPVQELIQPAKKEEKAQVEQKKFEKVEKAPQKEEEETVDISNELKKLRKVPDENNQEGENCIAYRDADGDKYGDEKDFIEYKCGTDLEVGYTDKKGDCNDRNRYVNPGAVETCNGGDDNCDGIVDPEDADMCNRYYKDMDGDGVGVAEFKCLCVSKGLFASLETGDCDDSNKNVHQNAREICNTVDDNCNGQIDEGENLKDCRPFYFDKDGDGFGYQEKSKCLCKPDGLYRAEVLGDCNDDNFNVNPGVAEIFDRRDNNCNGIIDENVGQIPKRYRKGKHHGKRRHHNKKRIETPKKIETATKDEEEKKKKPKKNSAVIF